MVVEAVLVALAEELGLFGRGGHGPELGPAGNAGQHQPAVRREPREVLERLLPVVADGAHGGQAIVEVEEAKLVAVVEEGPLAVAADAQSGDVGRAAALLLHQLGERLADLPEPERAVLPSRDQPAFRREGERRYRAA